MTCNLHEVIAQTSPGQLSIRIESVLDKPLGTFLRLANEFNREAANAICFDMGHESSLQDMQGLPDLFKLPFPTCWFQGLVDVDSDEFTIGILARVIADGRIVLHVFSRKNGFGKAWSLKFCAGQVPNDTGELSYIVWPPEKTESANDVIEWLCVYLTALNCVNVSRVENHPDPQAQTGRQTRKQVPFFSYWTLQIDLDRPGSSHDGSGGSQASRRLHLRRAHFKRLPTGLFLWREHIVGNKNAGLVHKSYSTKPSKPTDPNTAN